MMNALLNYIQISGGPSKICEIRDDDNVYLSLTNDLIFKIRELSINLYESQKTYLNIIVNGKIISPFEGEKTIEDILKNDNNNKYLKYKNKYLSLKKKI